MLREDDVQVQCWCKQKNCNGAWMSRSLKIKHEEADRKAASRKTAGGRRTVVFGQSAAKASTSAVSTTGPSTVPGSESSLGHFSDSLPGLAGVGVAIPASLPDPVPQWPFSYAPASRTPPPLTPPPVFSPRRQAQIAAAEQEGAQVVASAYASGDIPDLTIDEDDWEDFSESEDDESDDESSLGKAAPSTSSPEASIGGISSAALVVEAELSSAYGSDAATTAQHAPHSELRNDPFQRVHHTPAPVPSPGEVHPHPAAYQIYLVVLWLHTQCKLPFRACNTLLVLISIILSTASVTLDPPLCTTLTTVMAQLNADADFQELPVCTACLRPYPPDSSGTAVCASCGSALYDTQPTTIQQRSGRTSRTRPKPFLQCPYKSLEEQLCELIPEIENLVDGWRAKPRTSGKYGDHFDGEVCKNLEGPDGSPFFRPDLSELPDGELRIGVTLGVDWFSYRRSLISASHSSCPMSFSIINLPPSLRYRAANLILTAIMPGPQEQSADEVQHFLHVIVDDLLRLWKDGIKISTPRFPDGRVVRVALVGIVCDKPAAHKLAGYGSHSHRHFCTLCWAEQKKKEPFTTRIFEENGYPRRTNQQHREHQERYRACKTDGAREAFVKEHAARWSELSRLPYFNFEKMVIIDPMHNLFLGLVKNHFYHIWVKSKVLRKTKELNHLHAILNKMKMPSKVGRLPQLIGEPAGGSLTADQWLLLATLIGPLAIPQIWQDYAAADPAATLAARKIAITAAVHERRAAAAAKRKTAKQKKAQRTAAARQRDPAAAPAAAPIRRSQRTRTQTRKAQGIDAASGSEAEESGDEWVDDGALEDSEDETFDDEGSRRKRPRRNGDTDDPRRPSQLVPDDVTNFLKLCEALQLLLLSEITEEQVVRAEKLIREYGIGLIELYGADVLKPNHHYATHIGEFVRNMGPLHCFWTFLFERMNKILKSYKTNNHGGGEIEVTFFREFHRTIRTSRMLANGARASSETGLPRAVEAMSKTSEDDRGTVQALAQELDEQYEHAGIKLRMSTRYETANPSPELYSALLRFFQTCVPDIRYRSWIAAGDDESYPLMPSAIFFDHVVINQRRYTSLLRSNASAEALVVVRINDAGSTWVGELLEIFSTTQIPLGTRVFGYMRWFVPFEKDITLTPWRECARLGVRLWQHGIYLTPDDNGPSPIIDLEHIIGHAVRADITVGEAEAWATNVVRPVGALIPYPL